MATINIKNCLIQQNRMILKINYPKFKHRKIAVTKSQLLIL